ncbi:unnamed protein product [Didymodactylos carnosus]|uniref:Uncharacterized protein n=1 Tax=Didymodactylos carnosus TaxID=1234261 RepID=A0A814YJV5_9BILA|nr:unnamed protein product [Didymodactylos carnosus]CAF1230490.1 unnamed protein product [Didymodactylos carnosus]CAF3665888.1 unnamed protein product [Didymodactylos carnosus]CAF3993172.1 unnamed protein product [Didymodactylos carnosus]
MRDRRPGSIMEMLAFQVRQRPDQCCLLYPHPLHMDSYISITYRQFDTLLNRLANKLLTILPDINDTKSSTFETPVISLLANSDVNYLLMIYSLLKLDIVVFPLSTRNDKEAVQHLIEKTDAKYLFVSSQYLPIANEIKTKLNSSLHIQILDDLYLTDNELIHQCEESSDVHFSVEISSNNEAKLQQAPLIFHSSGSTALPKPIHLTCKRLLSTYFIYISVHPDYWRNDDVLLAWGPLYHLFAFCMTIVIWQAGGAFALPLAKVYPPQPTKLLSNIECKQITTLITVPDLLEKLVQMIKISDNQQYYYELLQRLRFIGFGGASCSNELCQELDDHHVQTRCFIGGTETGIIMVSDPENNKNLKRWKWMKLLAMRKPYTQIVSLTNDDESKCLKEIVFLSNDPFNTKSISNRPDGSYSSGDLFSEHPDMPDYFTIESRLDDILVHSNGEKTNPIPIEYKIKEHAIIKNAMVFGHKYFCAGVLIQLNTEEAMKYEFNKIEEKVWLAVQHGNQHSPEHSKIVQEMIKILPLNNVLKTVSKKAWDIVYKRPDCSELCSKLFVLKRSELFTDKGNTMRKKVLAHYSSTIENMYEKFLNGKDDDQNKRQHIKLHTATSIGDYLQQIISSILSKPYSSLNDRKQLFSNLSIDSLNMTRLHRQICDKIVAIPKHLLYENPSIDTLAKKLLNLINSNNEWTSEKAINEYIQNSIKNVCKSVHTNKYLSLTNELSKQLWNDLTEQNDSNKQTEEVLDKYIERIKKDVNYENTKQIVLMTGATGSLGSWILHYLLENVQIQHCYCLIRGENPHQRLNESFKSRQLNTSLLENKSRLTLLTFHDYNKEKFGLSNDIYDQLQQNVTDILHVGWKVNFNVNVTQFEQDCIQNLYHLLKLAKSTSKRFHFISSIASSNSGLQLVIKEERLKRNSQLATNNGYGQSKYIAEHMCYAARDLWNVPTHIYRCGQLSGDTLYGIWNRSEIISMMLCASGAMGVMPRCEQMLNWLPVNEAAECIVDLVINSTRQKRDNDNYVYHLENPDRINWQTFLDYLLDAGLQCTIVDKDDWLKRLRETQAKHPAMMLYDFYEKYLSKQSNQLVQFETVNTVQQTKLLENCSKINSDLIRLYLNYWYQCGDLTGEYFTNADFI